MGVKNRNALVSSNDVKKSIMYSAQLAYLSILRNEGLITDNEEYLYLQQKIRDKYRENPVY
jgi:hypothetical protein